MHDGLHLPCLAGCCGTRGASRSARGVRGPGSAVCGRGEDDDEDEEEQEHEHDSGGSVALRRAAFPATLRAWNSTP